MEVHSRHDIKTIYRGRASIFLSLPHIPRVMERMGERFQVEPNSRDAERFHAEREDWRQFNGS